MWDHNLIRRGCEHLRDAMTSRELTAIHLEAAIASVHAAAPSFDETDWRALSHHYAMLEELKPTPVVRLNAAIAFAYADGPAAGLARLDAIAGNRRLAHYAPFHAARGDLALKLDRRREAGAAFAKALGCPVNNVEREYLEMKLRECRQQVS